MRRLFLDACALFPVATREILLNYARAGGFAPLWSPRVAEEWARAAEAKQGAGDAARARGDAALMKAWFPSGEIAARAPLDPDLRLPDPDDAHVIAAALAGGAEAIVTFNMRDFPPRVLSPLGLGRLHPDEFLRLALATDAMRLEAVLTPLADMAAARGMEFRVFLKRAGLPRLGKAWARR